MVIERPPATQPHSRNRHAKSGRSQNINSSFQCPRLETVVECIRPKHDLRLARIRSVPFIEGSLKRFARKRWQCSLFCNANNFLDCAAHQRHSYNPIRQPRGKRSYLCPLINPSEHKRPERSAPPFPVVRKKLRLVCRTSTFTGQSPLHPLHDKHKSSASLTSSLLHASGKISPRVISQSKCARPRVECFSSRVTI